MPIVETVKEFLDRLSSGEVMSTKGLLVLGNDGTISNETMIYVTAVILVLCLTWPFWKDIFSKSPPR